MLALGFRQPLLPNVEEIRRLRRALGLSQTRLATLAGISQSAVTRIELGQASPSYTVVKRIFELLEAERGQKEHVATVARILSPLIVSVNPSTTLEEAVSEMRRHRFSQLPVLHERNPVGSLSEVTIANLILSGRSSSDFSRIRVDEVMESPFPTLDRESPVNLAAGLLQHYAAVLVTHKGDVQGIVTKSDLLKLV